MVGWMSDHCWIVVACAGLVIGAAVAQPYPAPPVETSMVVRTELAPTLWAPGTVVSRNDARIAAEVAGRITSIAEPGETFQQGQVLARIDDRSLRLKLAENEAAIGQLLARLNYNDRQMGRLQQLADQNSASRTQLDEITADRDVVRLQLTSARAARDQVSYDLERTRVVAPFSGQWVARHQQVGEYTSIGGLLGRLVDTDHKEVRARAPVAVAPFVSSGMMLGVKSDAAAVRYPVRAIIPVGDEISRSLEIRVVVDDAQLLVGSAVRVAVPVAFPEHVTAVPRDALVIRRDETYVFRIVEDHAERIVVIVGSAEADLLAVSGELSAGDRVVVRGAERLRDGQQVRVIGRRDAGAEPGD